MSSLGYYVPAGSVIHRLDPRVKIIVSISLSMLVLHASPTVLSLVSGFLLLLNFMARLDLRTVWLAIKPTLPLPLLIFLLHLLFTPGPPIPLFALLHLPLTYQGLSGGALLAWRFLLLFSGALLLTMVTLPSEMIRGLEKLLKPLEVLRIPVSDLALMLSLALRFLPIIDEELNQIREAQSARGARFHSGNPLLRMRTTASLVIPLVFNTCTRADELTEAMESRGYQGGPRTYLPLGQRET
jgi:energy-coupling factor transporter transmembrane protein EcfT